MKVEAPKKEEEENGLYELAFFCFWVRLSDNFCSCFFAAEEDYFDDEEPEEEPESYSLAKMLNNRGDDDYYGYDDYD